MFEIRDPGARDGVVRSLHGARPAPDFSDLALAHLAQRGDAFRQHVREHLEGDPTEGTLERLGDDLKRFRNTLVLLECTGAVFVAEELLELLAARQGGRLSDSPQNRDEFARVLVSAGDQLGRHVAALRSVDSSASALQLLPLVNDSRACRDAPLLSESLVLAAGIALPALLDNPTGAALDALASTARVARSDFGHSLLAWFRRPCGQPPPRPLETFSELASACRATSLDALAPMFDAAGVVHAALRDGTLEDGPAPRKLFARLERWLYGIDPQAGVSVPKDLYRDLLYYVALLDPVEPLIIALRNRFDLGRIGAALEAADEHATCPALGVQVAAAIRDSLDGETLELREWLDQTPTGAVRPQVMRPQVMRLRERLQRIEPVLTLLDARDARSWLRRIIETLQHIVDDRPVDAAERLMLAESLIRLDRALDEASVGRVEQAANADQVAPHYTSGSDPAWRQAVDDATAACLSEARRQLQAVGESLDAPQLVTSTDGDARLSRIEGALSLLAMPEVGPLLRGLRAANARIGVATPPAVRETLANLLASLEFYLGCVLRPDTGSQRLLLDAEEALARLEARLAPRGDESQHATAGETGHATGHATGHETTDEVGVCRPDEEAHDARIDERTRRALTCMDQIGDVLTRGGVRGVSIDDLRSPFKSLAAAASDGGGHDLQALAEAVLQLLDSLDSAHSSNGADTADTATGVTGRSGASGPSGASGASGSTVPTSERVLLEEAHAVLPQLIEQVHGSSGRVRGLGALLGDLHAAATASSGSSDSDAEGFIGRGVMTGLSPARNDALHDGADPGVMTFDDPLQAIFHQECSALIDALETTLTRNAVPDDELLRNLHALCGTARTVDARSLVEISEPMQRIVLLRHRANRGFEPDEQHFLLELCRALRVRLDLLDSGETPASDIVDIEARLPAFVRSASQQHRDGPSSRGVAPSLGDVFDEEARELLAHLQKAVAPSDGEAAGAALDRALGYLHTLKGSARMAGRHAVADRTHALEGLVQGMPDPEARRLALRAGRRELQLLLLDALPSSNAAAKSSTPDVPAGYSTTANATTAKPERHARTETGAIAVDNASPDSSALRDTASVPAATFESLLTLATDVTVSQARLSDDIARVREICRDLESAAGRWHRLPHGTPLLDSPAAREMLADLDTARRELSDAARLADVEQQHASRAAATLQQTLIRTRLVRVDDLGKRLEDALEDAAAEIDREVRLFIGGGDVTLDGALARQLLGPLEHIIRNAVVHGVEPPEERERLGKDRVGTVRLTAVVDGTELVLEIEDDGRGVDREAVNRRRVALGQPPVDTVDALQDVLCEAGFTTLESASTIAGRGLGLSAVSDGLARLDGRLHIGTRSGQGTRVTCRLRQRIIVSQVVLVQCARRIYALPVNVVHRIGTADDGIDSRMPRHALLALLDGVASGTRDEGSTDDTGAFVDGSTEISVEAGGRAFVLVVDRVLGYRELLTQPLGPQLASLNRYAGGSVLPDGRQVLVLQLERLVEDGCVGSDTSVGRGRRDPESMRPIALVVDDSITLRVAAASMLGRRGVESREARDGIEALDSLERGLPDLMIVDLDMPRLGGFDLMRRMRERFAERTPPVIVISSRDGDDDRERAAELGVVRFLTKPYTELELHEALLATGLRLPDLTIA